MLGFVDGPAGAEQCQPYARCGNECPCVGHVRLIIAPGITALAGVEPPDPAVVPRFRPRTAPHRVRRHQQAPAGRLPAAAIVGRRPPPDLEPQALARIHRRRGGHLLHEVRGQDLQRPRCVHDWPAAAPFAASPPALAVKQQCAAISPRAAIQHARGRLRPRPATTSVRSSAAAWLAPVESCRHQRQQLRIGGSMPRNAIPVDSAGGVRSTARWKSGPDASCASGLKGFSGLNGPPARPLNCQNSWRGVIAPRGSSCHCVTMSPTGSSSRFAAPRWISAPTAAPAGTLPSSRPSTGVRWSSAPAAKYARVAAIADRPPATLRDAFPGSRHASVGSTAMVNGSGALPARRVCVGPVFQVPGHPRCARRRATARRAARRANGRPGRRQQARR